MKSGSSDSTTINIDRIDSGVLNEMQLEACARLGKEFQLKVITGSMSPLIQMGDSVVVVFVEEPESLKIGDIAVFNFDGILVTHRIINRFEKDDLLFFRQKGDASFKAASVSADCIIGKVIGIKRNSYLMKLDSFKWDLLNRAVGLIFMMIDVGYRNGKAFEIQYYSENHSPLSNYVKRICSRILRKTNNIVTASLRYAGGDK